MSQALLSCRIVAAGVAEPQQDTDKGSESDEEQPDPAVALASIDAAQQELTILTDLVSSIAGQQAISVQYVDTGEPSVDKAFDQAALAAEQAKSALRAGASRMRSAAATLRRQVAQDNAYVQHLSTLQSFWRLQPSGDGAFHAVLAFPLSLAPDRTLSHQGPVPPLPPYKHVRIMPGLSGAPVVSMVTAEKTPTVQVRTMSFDMHAYATCIRHVLLRKHV
jgi:hypothetical protein